MTTTADHYAAQFTRQKSNDIQREAVAAYLLKYGEINRDFAYDVGLEACGRIKNLGGRIHELRADGWEIATIIRDGVCFYRLVSEPRAQQLSFI
jgi:hypothetical protein